MRWILIAVGCLSLALGTVGVFLPILPTTPFYLITLFCFAKSSDRLNRWFLSTKLYKKHLESFVKKKAMTVKAKLAVLSTVTLLMGFGFVMMKSVPVGRICLAAVWVAHLIYFIAFVRTAKPQDAGETTDV